jgi:hypothetical protein
VIVADKVVSDGGTPVTVLLEADLAGARWHVVGCIGGGSLVRDDFGDRSCSAILAWVDCADLVARTRKRHLELTSDPGKEAS